VLRPTPAPARRRRSPHPVEPNRGLPLRQWRDRRRPAAVDCGNGGTGGDQQPLTSGLAERNQPGGSGYLIFGPGPGVAGRGFQQRNIPPGRRQAEQSGETAARRIPPRRRFIETKIAAASSRPRSASNRASAAPSCWSSRCNSAASREACSRAFQCRAASTSRSRQARYSRARIGISSHCTLWSSKPRIQPPALASSRTQPRSTAHSNPCE